VVCGGKKLHLILTAVARKVIEVVNGSVEVIAGVVYAVDVRPYDLQGYCVIRHDTMAVVNSLGKGKTRPYDGNAMTSYRPTHLWSILGARP
jgi:hypothetical protein